MNTENIAGRHYPQWVITITNPDGKTVGRVKFAPQIAVELHNIHGIDGRPEVIDLTMTAMKTLLEEIMEKYPASENLTDSGKGTKFRV